MPDDKDTQKEAMKEGIKEWMDAQFAAFGRFTFYGLLAAAFAGMMYLAMVGAGWHK